MCVCVCLDSTSAAEKRFHVLTQDISQVPFHRFQTESPHLIDLDGELNFSPSRLHPEIQARYMVHFRQMSPP